MTFATKSPTSSRRVRIALTGGRYSGTFRPPNFEELAHCYSLTTGPEQKETLFDLTALEDVDRKAMPALAKRSFALQIMKLAGEDLVAMEVSEHDLPDDAAAAVLDKRDKAPARALVFLRIEDDVVCFLEPAPHRLEADVAKKGKGAIAAPLDLRLVEDHAFFGTDKLEVFKREKPLALAALASKLFEIGGLSLEAAVGEA